MTPKVKIFEMSFQIPQRDTGRCEVAERSSGLPHKKLGFRGTRPNPHFAQNGPIAPKIPWMLSPLYNNNSKFISSRQVQSVKQTEYKQRVLIIAYRRLPESYKLSMLATYDT